MWKLHSLAGKHISKHLEHGLKYTVGRRGLVTQSQRRKATTASGLGLTYPVIDHKYDAIVVGAGGAGLRAAVGLAESGLETACISKLFV
ncbi:putative succinate dehydrogenase [Glarea lozoyensis 74030]|uniref:Putative succinate dehydrogenase n=1 Tax=Glarea lozoyensis (strain ATCC 74030 / MF5533) TaxID=1104152 RepID=H0EY03_GLAL7|nr:putative succinate dehydrogenase [Glarea lozoyensis 74030]